MYTYMLLCHSICFRCCCNSTYMNKSAQDSSSCRYTMLQLALCLLDRSLFPGAEDSRMCYASSFEQVLLCCYISFSRRSLAIVVVAVRCTSTRRARLFTEPVLAVLDCSPFRYSQYTVFLLATVMIVKTSWFTFSRLTQTRKLYVHCHNYIFSRKVLVLESVRDNDQFVNKR